MNENVEKEISETPIPSIEDIRVMRRQIKTLIKENELVKTLIAADNLSENDKRLLVWMYLRFAGITPSSSFYTLEELANMLILERD